MTPNPPAGERTAKLKVHWRKRVHKWHGWIVRPLCNVQDIAKNPYEATTFRKDVTCRSCIKIGEKKQNNQERK